ncbi:Lrp/AsnC family transcriptional regulator [Saccharopolyspora erythraea]|uniref:AsnC-family transcriptional regulator n=1 Tax=Saccharopolyspora erythraea (strain ATCC 11635 / DSM 40517 / JCM 4748 / NBRC 13426 / NCIMB 8594 / NRRL 2338) TaxID=405948 RepID=A4FKC9_SACEN|nr:Lrp/AsnC ligand binding domain-containing protein [Saccharopolyspora erythraea]CAM04504.1 AsnC-family transcriptional regulator [Saccharopolyspora erythraea NRRL 2338]
MDPGGECGARRVRPVERDVDPADALGLNFEALVFVTMRSADRETLDSVVQAVARVPHVLQAQRLFGDPDCLLRVITRDLPAFQELYDERLSTLPGVQRLSSTLVTKSVVENRPLPL